MNVRNLITIVATTAILSAEAKISISNVVCQQQYPWNGKVDIDYEIIGDSSATNVYVYATGFDKTTNKTIEMRSVVGDGADAPIKVGKHRMTWDSTVDCPNLKSSAFSVTLTGFNGTPLYMVIDLSAGPDATNYPISYLPNEPIGGWTDEFKTYKMVFRLILPGTFTMGSPEDELGRGSNETQHKVTITRPFYIGIFEVTQKQYELIMGTNPSNYEGDARPVEYVSYDLIRGSNKGAGWPVNNEVDETSFMGKLRSKVKISFDLPTEAQWEYACRAGTMSALNSGKNLSDVYQCAEMAEVGRYCYNEDDGKGGYGEHTTVGSYLPNAWGLYDMHGNVYEFCLDWFQSDLGNSAVTDPVGAASGNYRIIRGGSCIYEAYICRSASRYSHGEETSFCWCIGFRVAAVQ